MNERGEARPKDCWREIGISGDLSCPRLTECVLCRNCQEYTRAGNQLFEREIPEEFRDEWTADLEVPSETDAKEQVSVIIFRIGSEWLALKTASVERTVGMRAVHCVPHRSNNVFKGIVNVNGELLLSMSPTDLPEMGGSPAEDGPAGGRAFERMLVSRLEGERYVFPVDEVLGAYRLSRERFYDPPATLSKSPISLVESVLDFEGKRVVLLDESRFHRALKRGLAT